ncbi:MAG TPA: alpha-hydroxy acid oxidase [Pseudomonadota bacterium]|nr:alpha-hydroxy acid oxidase [Pseudomonadota bacterium]
MSSSALSSVVNIEDLRRLAQRRLPRAVFDYIDGGADAEVTLRENCTAFERWCLRPRCAVAVPEVELATKVLGLPIAMPVILAPVGSCRMFYPRGDEVAAREAGRAGTIHTLSTLSGCRLEDVRSATEGASFYQLYLVGGRDAALAAIARARAAGYSALVVTVDTPVAGLRERDLRNGTKQLLSGGLASLPYLPQFARRPGWVLDFLRDGGLMDFPNVVPPGGAPLPYSDVSVALEQTTVTWADFGWIREAWGGPIVVKGLLTADDARRAVDVGAAAVVVSNHGARQLDGVVPSLVALPEVVAAVGAQVEVWLDGGVRRGSEVVKALCLGARAVLIGRTYAYALGAAGGPGVARALAILRADIIRTLKLLGVAGLSELGRGLLQRIDGT